MYGSFLRYPVLNFTIIWCTTGIAYLFYIKIQVLVCPKVLPAEIINNMRGHNEKKRNNNY